MADEDNSIEGRPPDPFVASRINNPAEPPVASFELAGLLGDSDRDGYRRLYLNTRLDCYAEFRVDDVLAVESIGAETPPFVGLDATRVTLKRDTAVNYVRSRSGPRGGFELDAQLAVPGGDLEGGFIPDPTDTGGLPTNITDTGLSFGRCIPDTVDQCIQTVDTCFQTVVTCWTCGNAACFTQQRTCFKTLCATCQTCNWATCRTCNAGKCWHTIANATCIAQVCISQGIRCPTVVCP